MYAEFHRILVAMDGREGGLDAAALAAVLTSDETECAVAHVLPGRGAPGPAGELAARASRILGAEPRVLSSRGPSVSAGLHDLVGSFGADLLVVGAHHARHLAFLAHDHTRETVRDLPCAVAVATWGYAAGPLPAIRKVGVGYTDDEGGRAVLDAARGVAWQLGAEVHATTVVPPSHWDAADSGAGWRAIAAGRRMAEIPGVHGVAVEGVPRRALAALSADVDLLVIGSRHRGAASHLLHGDVAGSLSHDARCPLMVVPRPEG